MFETTKKILKSIWKGDHRINKKHKEYKNEHKIIEKHIYSQGEKETVSQVSTRMYHIHSIVKQRILRPILLLLDHYNKKHLKAIPQETHNQNIIVFNRAFDRSIEEWHQKNLRHAYSVPVTRSPKYWAEQQRIKGSGQILKTVKETTLLVALTDTAYRNFLDILMYNITDEMNKEYSGKQPHHLFYTQSNIISPEYYYLHHCFKTGELQVYRTWEKNCCELLALQQAAKIVAENKKQEFLKKAMEAERKGIRLPPEESAIRYILEDYSDEELEEYKTKNS